MRNVSEFILYLGACTLLLVPANCNSGHGTDAAWDTGGDYTESLVTDEGKTVDIGPDEVISELDLGEEDVVSRDPCEPNPCTQEHMTKCSDDGSDNAVCSCDDGYKDYGDGTCKPVNPCATDEKCAANHRECKNNLGMAECGDCVGGYHESEGDCVRDIACEENTCSGHGQCDDSSGVPVCSCDQGYAGDHCEDCDRSNGWHWNAGKDACTDDPCDPDPCNATNNRVCEAGTGKCICKEGFCDIDNTCIADGTGNPEHACLVCDFRANRNGWSFRKPDFECRAATGVCDVAEFCTGDGPDCPNDAKLGNDTVCRAAAGPCDVTETCDGVNDECPADVFQKQGVECRAAAGVCDVAEFCTGDGPDCPDDAKLGNDTVCRAAAGPCDVTETCDGVNDECPADAKLGTDVKCRDADGACDEDDFCNGTGNDCPDTYKDAGTVCRPVGWTTVYDTPFDTDTGWYPVGVNGTNEWAWENEDGKTMLVHHGDGAGTLRYDKSWQDCKITVKFKSPGTGVIGVLARVLSRWNYYQFSLDLPRKRIAITAIENGRGRSIVANYHYTPYVANEVTEMSFKVTGNHLEGFVNNELVLDGVDTDNAFSQGGIGVMDYGIDGAQFHHLTVSTPNKCDVVEVCTGDGPDCPADLFAPEGTPCDDDDLCNGREICDNNGICQDGTPVVCDADHRHCVSDTGTCDCDEGYKDYGDGTCKPVDPCANDTSCPTQHKVCVNNNGDVKCGDCISGWHAEGDACVQDTACEPNSCSQHGTCDDSAGYPVCTCHEGYVGENCASCDTTNGWHWNEAGDACTTDPCDPNPCNASDNRVCEAGTGACVCAEHFCDIGGICIPDGTTNPEHACMFCDSAKNKNGWTLRGNGYECRPSRGTCDPAEVCDGQGQDCPVDVKSGTDTVCRPARGACDLPENCNGTDDDCPEDRFMSSSTRCRASVMSTVFEDSFDQDIGWHLITVNGAPNYEWTTLDGEGVLIEHSDSASLMQYGNANWTNYKVSMVFNTPSSGRVGVLARVVSTWNYYYFSINFDQDRVVLGAVVDGSAKAPVAVNALPTGVTQNKDIEIALNVEGNHLEGYVNGKLVVQGDDNTFSAGKLGFMVYACPETIFKRLDMLENSPCDKAEFCTGDAPDCPQDAFMSANTVCRTAGPAATTFFDDPMDADLGWTFVNLGETPAHWYWTQVDGEGALVQDVNTESLAYAGNASWADYEINLRFKSADNDGVGVIARYQDKDNYYLFNLNLEKHTIKLLKMLNGKPEILAMATGVPAYTQYQDSEISLRVNGNRLEAYISGDQVLTANDDSFSTGKIGLYNWFSRNVAYKHVAVYKLNNCDVPEQCSGDSARCPADAFAPNSTACDDPSTDKSGCWDGVCSPCICTTTDYCCDGCFPIHEGAGCDDGVPNTWARCEKGVCFGRKEITLANGTGFHPQHLAFSHAGSGNWDSYDLAAGNNTAYDHAPKLKVWILSSDSLETINTKTATISGTDNNITSVAFSPDGTILAAGLASATCGSRAKVELVHYPSMNPMLLCGVLTSHRYDCNVMSVAFSPDGYRVAAGITNNTATVWRVSDCNLVRVLRGHSNVVESVAFYRDERTLASGSADRSIKFWYVNNGSLTRTMSGHLRTVYSLAFSPDGELLASGSADHTIKLWRVSDGSLVRTLQGHTGEVRSVAFSPDGKLLASGSTDASVKLWRVKDGSLVFTLRGNSKTVLSVDFSPDGKVVASVGLNHIVRLWDITGVE